MVEELEGDMSVKQSFCGFHLLVFFFFNFLFFIGISPNSNIVTISGE